MFKIALTEVANHIKILTNDSIDLFEAFFLTDMGSSELKFCKFF